MEVGGSTSLTVNQVPIVGPENVDEPRLIAAGRSGNRVAVRPLAPGGEQRQRDGRDELPHGPAKKALVRAHSASIQPPKSSKEIFSSSTPSSSSSFSTALFISGGPQK